MDEVLPMIKKNNSQYEIELLQQIHHYFIAPFANKKNKLIGVELEFPVVNLKNFYTDFSVTQMIMPKFIERFGFEVMQDDFDGRPVCVHNKMGDKISFDGTFNTLEFSLAPALNSRVMFERFHVFLAFIQEFLLSKNHLLSGLGLHPYYNSIDMTPINTSYYHALNMLLHHNDGINIWISSAAQTHVDASVDELVDTINLISRLSFVSAKLFSNSAYLSGPKAVDHGGAICCRDYFYQCFASVAASQGARFGLQLVKNLDDLTLGIKNHFIFRVFRENVGYISFAPIILKDYFCQEKVVGHVMTQTGIIKEYSFTPVFSDLKFLRPYNAVEPRIYGTLEVRGDCIQPVATVFAPAAFYAGVLQNRRKVEELLVSLGDFDPMDFRRRIIHRELPPQMTRAQLSRLMMQVVAAAEEGLIARNFGEESFIRPLYQRAETLKSPAEDNLDLLQKGMTLADVIKRNAAY
jgi:gamma-glutamylcysteine synthetase